MLKIILLYSLLLITSLCGASNTNTSTSLSINPETIEETFVRSGDAQLFCRFAGKVEPLIVIHGGPGLTQDYLLPQMYKLSESNLVIFYDQRGCGKSTGDINEDTITIESFVNDIEVIRQTFNLDKISILGHSWGGFLAMQYAIAHQEHIDKLILSNSTPTNSEGYVLFAQEYMKRMDPYQEELKKFTDSEGYPNKDPDLAEQYYRLVFRQYCYLPENAELLNVRMTPTVSLNGAKIAKIMRKILTDKPFNLNKDLNTLKTLTLILHGDVDPIPPIIAQNTHENISNSKYVLMKNCGHFPYVEDPTTYFKCINAFLNVKNVKY